MKKNLLFLMVTFFTSVTSFSQTIDQSNGTALIGGYVNIVNVTNALGQSITAGVSGSMTKIKVRVKNESSTFVSGNFQMRIFSGNGYGGTLLSTTTFAIATAPTSSGWDELDIILSTPIDITSGNFYTLDFKGIGTANVNMHSTGNNYANGGRYFNQDNSGYETSDLWFRTYVIAAADPCWSQISTGGSHSVAIAPNGTLWSWGYNNYGQLGLGDTTTRTAPTQIGTAINWQSVSCGGSHTLALKTDGTLWSWGYGSEGRLGLGNDSTNRNIPIQVGTDTNWQSVSSGGSHTLALKTDGTLWSWGNNFYGQLGLGDTTNRYAPIQVGADTNWQSVSGGSWHALAIKSNGDLWLWGKNDFGQLGLGDNAQRNIPAQLVTATNWQSISAGNENTLAIQTGGTLWSWGYNSNSQLGLGDINNRNIPTQVGTATNWQSVSSNLGLYRLAIKTDGTLWSWGSNNLGQLGLGDTMDRNTPVQVGTATNWQSVSCAAIHTVAVQTGGVLWSWGRNDYGQLGLGDTTQRNSPTEIECSTVLSNESFEVSNHIKMYPNPTYNFVTVEVNNLTNVKLQVVDITGKILMNKALNSNSNNVDVQLFPSGMYLFKVSSNEGVSTSKIIKN